MKSSFRRWLPLFISTLVIALVLFLVFTKKDALAAPPIGNPYWNLHKWVVANIGTNTDPDYIYDDIEEAYYEDGTYWYIFHFRGKELAVKEEFLYKVSPQQ